MIRTVVAGPATMVTSTRWVNGRVPPGAVAMMVIGKIPGEAVPIKPVESTCPALANPALTNRILAEPTTAPEASRASARIRRVSWATTTGLLGVIRSEAIVGAWRAARAMKKCANIRAHGKEKARKIRPPVLASQIQLLGECDHEQAAPVAEGLERNPELGRPPLLVDRGPHLPGRYSRPDSLGLVENKLGSGSDYTVFLNFLGLPIVDLSFVGPYGVYHSVYDNGIPGRPWFKHSLYAPTSTYAAMELPGVREAVDRGDWIGARREVGRLVERVNAVSAVLGR